MRASRPSDHFKESTEEVRIMSKLLMLALALSIVGCGKSATQQKLEDASYCVGFYVAQVEKPINRVALADSQRTYDLFVRMATDLLAKDGRAPSLATLSADPELDAALTQGSADWKKVLDANQADRPSLAMKFTEKCSKLRSEGIGK
jgi:hypothetical protein